MTTTERCRLIGGGPQLALSTPCLGHSAFLLAANSFNPFIYFRF
jgi:hypothetical protein